MILKRKDLFKLTNCLLAKDYFKWKTSYSGQEDFLHEKLILSVN